MSPMKQSQQSATSTRSSRQDSRPQTQARAGARGKSTAGKSDDDASKNEVSPTHLTEVDREWFNIRIRDLEEKLTRAQDERRQFEEETLTATTLLNKSKGDHDDIVQHFQRTLRSREDQCQELKERLKGLQMAREKEGNDYENQLTVCKRTFDNLEQKMQSEIKLLQGKLTSLEEFRIQKEAFERHIKSMEERLAEKEKELPQHLERMERQTVLRIEDLKEEQANKIRQLSLEMEQEALQKLSESSRRALEENTMLLRQIAALGGKMTTVESQLASARYQNQGYKALLQKLENKCSDITKQAAAEKARKKTQIDMEQILQRKAVQCDELEKTITDLRTEIASLKQRITHSEQERIKQLEMITELSYSNDKTRDAASKTKKRCDYLSKAVQSAKEIMATVLTTEKEDSDAIMGQVMEFINEDFESY